ncbi:SGNH/GDSL hydrolase family protein [Microbacterium sp. C7(2022)]|uniref:SGNH/GDSL hydrolase family protein n=1 Tax=Microbacterium sp. C7(2022) TaxID=2992759 RepID=UPI00237C212D|nr:SGNH/GDSL hydrolase family protein [Microbacterium sp. C7(2022)]MDE0546195.1 GDSL-type esterase/lipase family protein [Microbacterium sp. C7(2022)]
MRFTTKARRALAATAAATLLVTGTLATASAATAAPSPASITKMAAIGDSISQAAMSCSNLVLCMSNSWSTGTASSVASHASRMKSAGATSLRSYNNSVSGADSADLAAQAQRAVRQGAQYVTVQIGANDACASSVSAMTATTTYRDNVKAALDALAASDAEIFVASIPSLQRLYELNKGTVKARLAWATLRFCPSMLANPTSTKQADVDRRAAVQARVNEYNATLAELCAQTAKCRYDGGAVANYEFSKSDISTRDYFHPSVSGQASLSAVTWATTQWAS